jgi:uncharacterized protein (TIGR03435 family)
MSAAAARTIAALLLLGSDTAFAQDPGSIKFEVASVKLAAPDEDARSLMRGGPGTPDPDRITYERQNLIRFLSVAYGFQFDQISGPGWIGTDLFTVNAKLPPGTSKEQLKLMWQDFLRERFHLKTHLIQKDFPVYELSVAKGGPRFHQEPGFPVPRPGENWIVRPARRDIRLTFRGSSMADFATRLGWPLSTITALSALTLGRVVDKTGLAGLYSFTLEFSGGWGPGGAFLPPPDGETDPASNLFDALRQQLGLRLDEGKARLDVLVVDHADRIPTEN